MTMGEDNFEVVCVSSGTKCINGEKLSLEGCVINDCHAEIVARRCLVLYLYNQLRYLITKNNEDGGEAVTPEESTEDGENEVEVKKDDEEEASDKIKDEVASATKSKVCIFQPEPVEGKYM